VGGTAAIFGGAPADRPFDGGPLSALAALHRRLGVAATADDVVGAALGFVGGALRTQRVTVQLADADRTLQVRGAAGITERLRSALDRAGAEGAWPIDRSVPWASRSAVVLLDLTLADDLDPFGQALQDEGIATVVVVPLVPPDDAPSQPDAYLAAYWDGPRTLAEEERQLLEVAGGQLGSALHRLLGEHPRDDASSRLAAIVNSSDDAIIGKDLDGTITSWNPGAQRLYGYVAEEVIGRPFSLLVPADRPDELPAIMRRLRQGQHIEHYETTRIRKDGVQLTVSVSISPIRSSGGRVIGAASIARDITRRRQDEQRYLDLLASERAARERAERAADRTTRLQSLDWERRPERSGCSTTPGPSSTSSPPLGIRRASSTSGVRSRW
jgi:PAS domain S-box-containing protein